MGSQARFVGWEIRNLGDLETWGVGETRPIGHT